VQPDPTWAIEYDYFKKLCEKAVGNIDNDIWINDTLGRLCSDPGMNGGKGTSVPGRVEAP
jgi:hypothetical protein